MPFYVVHQQNIDRDMHFQRHRVRERESYKRVSIRAIRALNAFDAGGHTKGNTLKTTNNTHTHTCRHTKGNYVRGMYKYTSRLHQHQITTHKLILQSVYLYILCICLHNSSLVKVTDAQPLSTIMSSGVIICIYV